MTKSITFNTNGFRAVEVHDPISVYTGYEYSYLIKDLAFNSEKKLQIKKITIEFEEVVNIYDMIKDELKRTE